MSLTQELRAKYADLWENMVTHPFIMELGDGTLPVEKFRTYFLQDYVFVNDLVGMIALGMAKAPDFTAADHLNKFLAGFLDAENDLVYVYDAVKSADSNPDLAPRKTTPEPGGSAPNESQSRVLTIDLRKGAVVGSLDVALPVVASDIVFVPAA